MSRRRSEEDVCVTTARPPPPARDVQHDVRARGGRTTVTQSVNAEQVIDPAIEQHRRRFAAEYELDTEPTLHPYYCEHCKDCAEFIEEWWSDRLPASVLELYRAISSKKEEVAPAYEAAAAAVYDKSVPLLDTAGVPIELPSPTLKQFIRHAERFGPELVVETARTCLTSDEVNVLELAIIECGRKNGKRTTGSRRRRTTDKLEEHVLELDRRGMVRTAIADTLNIADRRVAEILRKSGTSQNGGQKRLAQATLLAD